MATKLTEKDFMIYPDANGDDGVKIAVKEGTMWATQKEMAQLFDVQVPDISKHLSNIFNDGELIESSTVSKMEIVRFEGGRYVERKLQCYNLDAIISVGFRVNSKKATKFRIWSNQVIGQYLNQGYVINEDQLKDSPEKLQRLAVKLRELRAEEKNVYASVRECFKLAASDYEPSSSEVRSFYALLQDKFHYAVTGMTASKVKIDRADHARANMGMSTVQSFFPTLKEAQIGKNYLTEHELYRLHLLSEQFLLYAEARALMGKEMNMQNLRDQLDKLLVLNEYSVMENYDDYLKDRAMQHAENEYKHFIEIQKLKLLGVDVDLDLYHDGEYEDFKDQTSQMTVRKMNNIMSKRAAIENQQPESNPE